MVMLRQLLKLSIVLAVIACTGCVTILRVDGPYRGKVVDADTNQPIHGAVVHAQWHKRYLGGGTEYYDSYEVLTDRNGDFTVPGLGVLVLSDVDKMIVTIVKVGYQQLTPSYWWGLREAVDDQITWVGNKGIFRLRPMTLEQRHRRVFSDPGVEPPEKDKLLRQEEHKENQEIGRN